MKRTLLAASIALASSGVMAADSLSHWGGSQDRYNHHMQAQVDDLEMFTRGHVQASLNEDRRRIIANEQWNDRQEGVIRQNRGRLDEHDQQLEEVKAHADRNTGLGEANQRRLNDNDAVNQRQNDSIDNAHARIDGVDRQVDIDRNKSLQRDQSLAGKLNETNSRVDTNASDVGTLYGETSANRGSIDNLSSRADTADNERDQIAGRVTTNARGINNNRSRVNVVEQRADAADADRENLYSTVESVNRNSIKRDNALGERIGSVDADSRDRDAQLDAYNRQTRDQVAQIDQWNVEQFNRQGAAISELRGDVDRNTQAIADERHERKEQGKDLNAGVAGALAAAAAQFDLSYYGTQLSVSGGAYRGESAVGLSIGARASERVFLNGGVVHDSRGHQGYNVGANIKF